MLNGQKIVVVMPAYNAARTLRKTYDEVMAHEIVDLVIVVDDASQDETVAIARTLDRVQVEVHPENRGYGGNQKTCYRLALAAGADIVVMIHPDYQYTPALLPAMASLVRATFIRACWLRAFSAAALCAAACRGGNIWANRFLLSFENFLSARSFLNITPATAPLSEPCWSGCQSKRTPTILFFDNQILAQIIWLGCPIGEVTCPAKYLPESSSINFRRSVRYGLGCLATALEYRLAKIARRWPSVFGPRNNAQ